MLITDAASERDSFVEECIVSETRPDTTKNLSRRQGIVAHGHELDACNLEVPRLQHDMFLLNKSCSLLWTGTHPFSWGVSSLHAIANIKLQC